MAKKPKGTQSIFHGDDNLDQINRAIVTNAGRGGLQTAFGLQDAYEQIIANGQPIKHNHSEAVLPVCHACGHKNRAGAEHCGQCGKAL